MTNRKPRLATRNGVLLAPYLVNVVGGAAAQLRRRRHATSGWRGAVGHCQEWLRSAGRRQKGAANAATTEHCRMQYLETELRSAHVMVELLRGEMDALLVSKEQARYDALHDGLTGLPNRQAFRLRLEEIVTRPCTATSAATLLYVDLDGFKRVNDTYGHPVGDELLRVIAARLTHAVRVNDMVARVGGDEFACLLMDIGDSNSIGRRVRSLLDAAAMPITLQGYAYRCDLSIGIALAPRAGIPVEALMTQADQAMYTAKRGRLGYAFFGG